jgi:predicted nucleic acid-binding protein
LKILLDTNVILDIAFERQPFYDDSDRVFSFVEEG